MATKRATHVLMLHEILLYYSFSSNTSHMVLRNKHSLVQKNILRFCESIGHVFFQCVISRLPEQK